MAGKIDELKLSEIKDGIGKIVAREGEKIDASLIRRKYQDLFGRSIPKRTKIVSFVKDHMSDDFEVIREGSVAYIKSKMKRKGTNNIELQCGKRRKECHSPVSPHSTSTMNDNNSDTASKPCLASATVSSMPVRTEPRIPTLMGRGPSMPNLSSLPCNPSMNAYETNFPNLNGSVAVANFPNLQHLPPPQKPKSKVFQQVRHHVDSSAPKLSNDAAVIRREVDKIIDQLSKNHYVEVDLVQKRLFERFKVRKLMELGNYRRVDDVPGIKELLRKIREINASIQAFVMVRSVCTLHELDRFLAGLYSECRTYEDLKLGPLVQHPLVYEYFKFPQNLDPPEITTLKVMKYLKQFMSKNGWVNKVDMQEFLEHLQKQMSCETFYELGVKIDSLGLVIKSIKNCCSTESTTRRESEQKMLDEIAEEIEQQMPKIKKQLLGSSIRDPDALVNQFLDLSPVDILQKLFQYCEKFFQGKNKTKVTRFVMMCNSDKPSRKLFQLALHKACFDLVKPPVDNVQQENKTSEEKRQTTKHNEEYGGGNSCPTQEELLNEVKRWLVGKSSRSFDLKLLARVEDSILDHYKGFTTFKDLGQGSFLRFLSENKELEALISISDAHAEESCLGLRKTDVIDLLQQCGVDAAKPQLHKVICVQYRNLSTNLNEKSLDGLIARACEQRSQQQAKTSVVYEASLVVDTLDSINVQVSDTRKEHVGVLGYQDKNNVLTCLYQTPLLENFVTWSQWHDVFEPMYGNLKSFLRRNSSDDSETSVNDTRYPPDLLAMETPSGSLLRITRKTSTDAFFKCAKRGNVIGTAGHLVSLVCQYGGVKKAPLALLASHMKEAFLSLTAELEANEESTKHVVRFTVKCLLRIPKLVRHALAMKIFIEPLKCVFGNGQTPGLVLKHCRTLDEKSMIHSLGIHFGVSEWQQDFKTKFEFSESFDLEEEDEIEAATIKNVNVKELKNSEADQQSLTNAEDGLIDEEKRIDEDQFGEHDSTDGKNIKCRENDMMSNTKEDECRAVIDSIRRDQFGIGIEFPPEHRQMMENQRSREGRGLHRLSSELYSKDTHFVLELVQNADDNRYSDNLLLPSIAFHVSVEKIEVFNNEVGFEEKNIRALCDVGKSTKGRQRYGYIGQKGIGFKSVFRITDTPQIHSNGYHIKFDAKSGPTGYILPHWIADKTDEDPALNDWTTRIVLPLKEEMKDVQKQTLIARFHDIQPSLLLFLRRLRQIELHDEVSNTSREMFRRDCGDKLIEITYSNGIDLWFVVKKELSASSMKEDIESTEIALAFPLPPRSKDSTISLRDVTTFIKAKSLIQQPVFAFLPLRSYGFRFIIQADFDVPSSREDVDKDSAWNQWLRHEVASLFVQAFDDFKNHDCFLGVASIVQLLQFIPLEDEILDFFKPLTQTILEGISRKQCIPVLAEHSINDSTFDLNDKADRSKTAENNEVEIKWVFPSQVVVAEDHLIEKLVSEQILNRYLNKCYLHPDLRAYIHAPLRQVLGIETISCRHLIDIGKTIASEVKIKMESQPDDITEFFVEFTKWVAKWLCCVYRRLEHERDCSDETLQEIAQIDIFPLSRGQCTAIFDRSVFLPLQDTIKGEQVKTKASRKAADIVHRELLSLHPLILESLDDIERPQVRKLLERLQVKCLTSRDLVKHHIIPALQETQNKSVSHPDVMFSYIVYIKDQWDLDPSVCDLKELCSCALIKTSKGFVNPSLEPVHFTVEYGNKSNLQKEFPSVPWTVVDNSYITSAKESRVSWEKFFSALGVVHFLAIERKDVSLSKSQLSGSVWTSLSEFWPQLSGNYIINDYGSSELEILLSAGSNGELHKLAEMLDQHWDEMYSKYTDVPYLDEQRKVRGQTFSSFFLNLKEKCWLPSNSSKSSSKPLQCSPCDVFMPNKEVVELLDDHALYATPSLVNAKFLEALGIRTSVNFDTLVSELMKWSGEDLENEDGGFTTSVDHMTNVYKFLESEIKNNDERKNYLEAVVKNRSVLFVPILSGKTSDPTDENPARKIRGTFPPPKRVCWSDPSKLMQDYPNETIISTDPRRMLDCYYPPFLKSFFVDFLGIDLSPNLKEYINLLERIASQSSIASGPIVDDMMRVYNVIAMKCLDQDSSASSTNFVKSQLLELNVFATTEEKWVSLNAKPLFCDDKTLAKLFTENKFEKKDGEASHVKASEEKVHFIKMGLQPKHRNKKKDVAFVNEEDEKVRIRKTVQEFFEVVCGIKNLSDCVTWEIIPTVASECPALQTFLFRWVPCIQRYLYSKDPDQHDKHQESGMATSLSNVKCFSAEELEVVYRLSTHPTVTESLKKTCGVDNNSYLTFYVTDSELKDTNNIITELAQLFVRSENVGDFSNFLHVLTNPKEDGIENYMESQDLPLLPDDVIEWMVPEPPPQIFEISTTTESPDDIHILTSVESMISSEPERQAEMQETDGEPKGLQCWPPRYTGTPVVGGTKPQNPTTEEVLAAWPPPAPPDAYISPEMEVVPAPALNVWQPQQQYDPKVVSEPPALSNGALDPGYEPSRDSNHQTTNESFSQPVVQYTQSQQNVSELISNANDNRSSTSAKVSHDDTTHQLRPNYQHAHPLRLGDVRVELEEVDLITAFGEGGLVSLSQSANAEEIGRWGEECVYMLLKHIEKDHQVVWVNETAESGLPYDIVIKGKDTEIFIEIKSTSTSEKRVLEISSQEIKCAFERKKDYHLYRVYNAGNPNVCRVARLRNLASNLDTKAVSLFILI